MYPWINGPRIYMHHTHTSTPTHTQTHQCIHTYFLPRTCANVHMHAQAYLERNLNGYLPAFALVIPFEVYSFVSKLIWSGALRLTDQCLPVFRFLARRCSTQTPMPVLESSFAVRPKASGARSRSCFCCAHQCMSGAPSQFALTRAPSFATCCLSRNTSKELCKEGGSNGVSHSQIRIQSCLDGSSTGSFLTE